MQRTQRFRRGLSLFVLSVLVINIFTADLPAVRQVTEGHGVYAERDFTTSRARWK